MKQSHLTGQQGVGEELIYVTLEMCGVYKIKDKEMEYKHYTLAGKVCFFSWEVNNFDTALQVY